MKLTQKQLIEMEAALSWIHAVLKDNPGTAICVYKGRTIFIDATSNFAMAVQEFEHLICPRITINLAVDPTPMLAGMEEAMQKVVRLRNAIIQEPNDSSEVVMMAMIDGVKEVASKLLPEGWEIRWGLDDGAWIDISPCLPDKETYVFKGHGNRLCVNTCIEEAVYRFYKDECCNIGDMPFDGQRARINSARPAMLGEVSKELPSPFDSNKDIREARKLLPTGWDLELILPRNVISFDPCLPGWHKIERSVMVHSETDLYTAISDNLPFAIDRAYMEHCDKPNADLSHTEKMQAINDKRKMILQTK